VNTGLRVATCTVAAIVVALAVAAFQRYAGFMKDSSYLAGAVGGIAVLATWQLTGRKKF
jgi:hypothetical protein